MKQISEQQRMKQAGEQRFRTITQANAYLRGRARAGEEIEAHEIGTDSAVVIRYFCVTLNGALIGRGQSIDEAVSDAERSLERAETVMPDLF